MITRKIEFEIDRECADLVEKATKIDPLAGNEYVYIVGEITEYDDDFGATPEYVADLNAVHLCGKGNEKDVLNAVKKIVTDYDLWLLAGEEEDVGFCDFLKKKRGRYVDTSNGLL